VVLAAPVPAAAGRWRLSFGVVVREFGDVTFRSAPRAVGFPLPAVFGDDRLSLLPGVGGSGGVTDRTYADGFVRVDSSGGRDGQTWNWGYSEATQVSGDSIRFHSGLGGSETRVSEDSRGAAGTSRDDIDPAAGPEVALDYVFPGAGPVRFSLGAGVSFTPFDAAQVEQATFSADQSAVHFDVGVVDSYLLGGVVPPDAPYAGSFEGPGPLLPDRPAGRRLLRSPSGRESARFDNRSQSTLEIDALRFSLGAGVEISGDRAFANLSAGPSLDVVDWEARHSESLTQRGPGAGTRQLGRWEDSSSGTGVLWGGFVKAGAGWRITERVSVEAFARYDWSERLNGSAGPSTFEAGGGGASGGLRVGVSF
jgi:hypothetical protein